MQTQPLVSQPLVAQPMGVQPIMSQPLMSNLPSGGLLTQANVSSSTIPTGIVQPMQSTQPLISGIAPMGMPVQPIVQPVAVQQPIGPIQPIGIQPMVQQAPILPGVGATTMSSSLIQGIPPMNTVAPLMSSQPLIPGMQPVQAVTGASFIGGVPPIATTIPSGVATALNSAPHISPVGIAQPLPNMGPGATSTPRASVTSIEGRAPSVESPLVDWAVPHQTKLKYTQIFNATDRQKTGYLSGAQARNVMVQTKLPQNILAQVW